jgi:sulfur relay (sulfurtransferase) DsrF/TusC family protein
VKNLHPVGMIFFEEGLITYAMTNSKVAEQAVFDILSMKDGSFQFLPGKKPTTRQMELDVMSALMENAKYVDENLDNSSKLIG